MIIFFLRMLNFLLLVAACVLAYRTNPGAEAFRAYLKQQDQQQQSTSWFSKWLKPRGRREVSFDAQDYGLFTLVRIPATQEAFIGAFHTFFPIHQDSSSAVDSESGASLTDQADHDRQLAIQAKSRRDCLYSDTLTISFIMPA